jgi:hypothetical protein
MMGPPRVGIAWNRGAIGLPMVAYFPVASDSIRIPTFQTPTFIVYGHCISPCLDVFSFHSVRLESRAANHPVSVPTSNMMNEVRRPAHTPRGHSKGTNFKLVSRTADPVGKASISVNESIGP